eukprot:4969074-Prorocentrum_lima.AAC.1
MWPTCDASRSHSDLSRGRHPLRHEALIAGCGDKAGPGGPDNTGHSHKDRTMRLDRSRDNTR